MALTEFRGENSVSSSQPIICGPERTHGVFRRTHRVSRRTQWASAASIHHVMWSFLAKIWPKTPKMITSHDILEPLKQALWAARDVIISGQILRLEVAERMLVALCSLFLNSTLETVLRPFPNVRPHYPAWLLAARAGLLEWCVWQSIAAAHVHASTQGRQRLASI